MTLAARIRLDMIGPPVSHATDSATPSATDWGWWIVGCVAVYVALFFLWTQFHWGGEQNRILIANFAFLPLKIALVALFWRTARHPELSPRLRWGWRALTLTMLCYGIANAVLWPYYELIQEQQPYPSWTDGGYADDYPYALYGFILFTVHPSVLLGLVLVTEFHEKGRAAWLKFGLDAGIVLVGAGTPVWYFLMRPIAEVYRYDLLETLVFLAYPTSPLLLLFGALMVLLIGSGPRNRRSLQCVALGVLLLCAGEMAFIHQTLQNDYRSGDPLDALYAVADLLLMIGAQLQYVQASAGSLGTATNRLGDLFKVLPYLAVVLAYGLLLSAVRDDWREPLGGLIFAAVILTALLLVRQFVANRENLRLRAERDQHESEARFAALVRKSSDLVTITDPYGVIQFISPAVQNLLGYEPDSLHRTPLPALLHPEDQQRGRDFFRDILRDAGVTAVIEWRMRCRDGSWLHVETVASNLRDDPLVQGIVLNSRNVSERRALEEQLRQLAFQDSLTRLANRVLFRDRVLHALERAERSGQPVAVMFLDLDNFKAINDSLGHGEGDRLLVTTARQLVRHTRASDTVARLGGDEFAILIEDVPPPESLKQLAERIVESLRVPFKLDKGDVLVTASMGIAISTGKESVDELLRNADAAMYAAKARGKHRYEMFSSRMRSAARDRLQLENDLRRALERDGELLLHYQPIVNLATGRLFGIEALARWQHPTLNNVSPSTFVPVAEESGLIVPLGNWVLREACRQMRRWREQSSAGGEPCIAVNVSAHQLQQPDFSSHVASELKRADVSPDTVVLEFAESTMMRNTPVVLERLRELSALGIRLALDDFGTGYASLSYLHRFPIQMLKIDRSFIERLDQDGEEAALARSIIAMSETLKIQMVAEGIEDEKQLRELRRLGCHLGQGHLFSKPVAAQEIAWLANGKWEKSLEPEFR